MHPILVVAFGLLMAAQSGPFAHWAGTWTKHGMALTVNPDGTATAEWRTYVWCGPGVTQACDAPDLSKVGGHAVIRFDHSRYQSALGTVIESTSTDSTATFRPGEIGLAAVQYGLGVVFHEGLAPGVTLCGPTYDTEAPPELKQQLPCGV